jgi:hypothetical protein
VLSPPPPEAPLDLTLTAIGSDETVPIRPVSSGYSYGTGAREGHAVAKFSIEHSGDYLFTSSYPAGRDGPTATFVIGPDPTTAFILELLALFGSVGGFVLAIALVAGTLLWRKLAKQGLAAFPTPPMAPGPVTTGQALHRAPGS